MESYTPFEFPNRKGAAGWRNSQLHDAGISGYRMEFAGPVLVIYVPTPQADAAEKAFTYQRKRRAPAWLAALAGGMVPGLLRIGVVALVIGVIYVAFRSGLPQQWAKNQIKSAAQEAVSEMVPDGVERIFGRATPAPAPTAAPERAAGILSLLPSRGGQEEAVPEPAFTAMPTAEPERTLLIWPSRQGKETVADAVDAVPMLDEKSGGAAGFGVLLVVFLMLGGGAFIVAQKAGVDLSGFAGAAAGTFRSLGAGIGKRLGR